MEEDIKILEEYKTRIKNAKSKKAVDKILISAIKNKKIRSFGELCSFAVYEKYRLEETWNKI